VVLLYRFTIELKVHQTFLLISLSLKKPQWVFSVGLHRISQWGDGGFNLKFLAFNLDFNGKNLYPAGNPSHAVTFVMSAVLICKWTLSHYDDGNDEAAPDNF